MFSVIKTLLYVIELLSFEYTVYLEYFPILRCIIANYLYCKLLQITIITFLFGEDSVVVLGTKTNIFYYSMHCSLYFYFYVGE